MLKILLAVLAVVVYLNIGFFLGHLHWIIFHEEKFDKIKREFLGRILWPYTSGKKPFSDFEPFIYSIFNHEYSYNITMSILWPIKILYLAIIGIVVGLFFSLFVIFLMLGKVLKILAKTLTFPLKKMIKI